MLTMTDVFSKVQRSKIMAQIRCKRTRPEVMLKTALIGTSLRYQPKMIGKPDFASAKHKIAVFVDGDFWHGYSWKTLGKIPPRKYWQGKIRGNMKRDRVIDLKLRRQGWKVFRFWEHDVVRNAEKCAKQIRVVLV